MGFMTMFLTNPFLYPWIVERAINEVKNLSMRVKKWIYAPIKPSGKDSAKRNRSRARPLHKNTQNVATLKESVTSTTQVLGQALKERTTINPWWIMKNY